MANYQNGQPYYGSHNHPAQGPQDAYGAQSSHNDPNLRRPSSFDTGDDAQNFGHSQDQSNWQSGYSGYGAGTNTGQYGGRTQPMSIQTSLPYRSNSQAVPLSGYQHQYQPQTPSLYNPAQYQHQQQQQQPQSQYNPQSYQSPLTAFPASSSYQPYVPAAYQTPNVTRQASVYNTNNYYNQTPQTAFPTSQAPAPPPRSSDYGGQQSASYGGYQHESQHAPQGHYSSGSVPTRQSTYSNTAPAPPPHETSVSTRPYSHSSSVRDRSSFSSLGAHQTPEINRNSSFASRISNQSSSFSPSPQPSIPTPPSRNPSNRSPQRSNTLDRHPQGRSLPGVPSESESDNDYFVPRESRHQSGQHSSASGFDDIMHDLDSAIGGRGSQAGVGDASGRTSGGGSPQPVLSPDEAPTHLNGNIASTGEAYINYGAFEDDSDAEAAAGLAAMQALDEQEKAEDLRRRSGSATLFPSQNQQTEADLRAQSSQDLSSDSDYTGYDLGAAGGGYAPSLSYGDDIPISNYAAAAAAMPQSELYSRLNPRMSSIRSSGVSSEGRDSQASGFESTDALHPFPGIRDVARVDTGGTGGLTEPSPHPRRLSYEDGDEGHFEWDEGPTPESGSPTKDSMPDLFFHPGMSQHRPLPPPPSNSDPGTRLPHLNTSGMYTQTQQNRFSQYTDNRSGHYPPAPDAYGSNALLSPSLVPRSTSLTSQRSKPPVDQPMRSKTDADRAKFLRQQSQSGRPLSDIYDPSEPSSAIPLDLPAIPRKKFNPAKLSNEHFKKCSEPWALSSILAWIRDLADEETDLRESAVTEGIEALFTNKVPTMNTTEAEILSNRVTKAMFTANALVKEEEWVKFGPGSMSGVLFQLTGSGCYSSKLHVNESRGRCYSHHCMRTLKVVDMTGLSSEKKSEDWATYYKLKSADMEGHDRKEVERQNNLHEIVTGEAGYIEALDILRTLYRDRLQSAQPSVLPSKKLPSFLKEVFGHVDKVKKINQDYLLGRLRYRQNEQGPWIVGFSDIFREWIRRARAVYVDYATNYPRADFLMRRESERNLQFRTFLDSAREDRRSSRLGWDNYLKSPITRLQRYTLLIQTVLKNTVKDSEEKTNLEYALDEIKAATHECDLKLAEQEKKMQLHEYGAKLRLRPQMDKDVELNLDHLGREVILAGNLLRAGGKGFNWVETHAILFDHYLVLSKKMKDHYDVSKVPIPMDLLVLESSSDPQVVRSGVKGIGAVTTTVVPRGQGAPDPRLARTTSTASGGSGGLQHTNTSTSLGSSNTNPSLVPITTIDSNAKDDKIMYPFRIKHLGRSEVYTLFAPSAANRTDWCDSIIAAKTKHAEQLYSQNSEPFRLRVLADTAFGYEGLSYPSKRISIRGTPLDRAIQESEKKYAGQGRPAPVCRAQVNCATVFNQPYGRLMCAIGTDYGVYVSEYQNSRGWMRAIQMQRVTQIAVLEEFNLFLMIADKILIAYHLDVICPPSGNALPQGDATSRRAPQKLSGSRDVGFFVTGRMKDRALVFYKKRDGINSTFKVLEPVLQKSATSRSRFLPSASRRGQTEFFREYDEFYIPTECYSLNLFQTSMAIATVRGVEVLNLEKKMPWTVPNLRSENSETQAHLASIANRIKDLRPLGMFRLGESEFLVTFDECAVYVNKHGDVSRGVVMEFVGRAKSACLYGQYLILFDDDFVEIRDAQNGRLKQVVAGRDLRMLDEGGVGTGAPQNPSGAQAALGGGVNGLGLQGFGAAPRTVKMSMQHPEYEKSHVIVELLLNSEKDKE